jgi:hypothetical protein
LREAERDGAGQQPGIPDVTREAVPSSLAE